MGESVFGGFPWLVALALVGMWVFSCFRVLPEYERGVVFRLGRLQAPPRGPGLIFILVPIDRLVRISLRTIVLDVPPQDIITRDNVSVKVNAVVYFRVVEPNRAVVEVENYHYATSQLSQTTLRSVLGQVELDDLLSQRERLNAQPRCSAPWRARRRPSARSGPRSSTPRGNIRPPRSWLGPRTRSARTR
jgi:regulator of protease activity HflC (stomatin/prohibitin superfamily)